MAGLFEDLIFSKTTEGTGISTPKSTPAPDPETLDLAEVGEDSVAQGEGLGLLTSPAGAEPSFREKLGRSLIGFSAGTRGGLTALRALSALNGGGGKDNRALNISRVMDATKKVIEVADSLTGEARDKQLVLGAAALNRIMPGSGESLLSIARRPDKGELILANMPDSKILKDSLATDPTGNSAMDLIKSKEGIELLQNEAELNAIPVINKKLFAFRAGFQQFVPKEMAERIKADNVVTESEVLEINNFLKNSPNEDDRKFALRDSELEVIGKHKATTLEANGILTGKNEQDLLKDSAKPKFKPGTIVDIPTGGKDFKKGVWDPDGKIFPEFPHEKGFAILGSGEKGSDRPEFPAITFDGVVKDEEGKDKTVKVQQSSEGSIRIAPIPPKVKDEKKSLVQELRELKEEKKNNEKDSNNKKGIPDSVQKLLDTDPRLKDATLGAATEKGFPVIINGEEVGFIKPDEKEE